MTTPHRYRLELPDGTIVNLDPDDLADGYTFDLDLDDDETDPHLSPVNLWPN